MKRTEQAASTEAALKAAARRVFARQGYLNTKITDITAEAGRAAGSFYNHFTGKEELLTALLTDALAESDAAIFAPDSQHRADFSDREAVRWHVANYWRFYSRHAVELTALRQAALVNAEFGAQLEEMTAGSVDHLDDHLDPITKAGRSLPGPPDLVLAMFAGLLDGFSYHWQLSEGRFGGRRVDDEEAIDTLTEFIYRALNGCPGD
ncbi:MAG TPA: TetR/AcrR family transcriptional regulator [Mycobacterium sp.]|uniref:TetR/AcrR family transcriptional regulator n=1 Tax=Mycobacterium sp. TaxID=1785 RepID=UPI002D39C6D6|nr:TetR/AcrR family transcriptional regulator [Mycobacterium sp.]HXY63330.1 TetR/AcrR family transcriptional regulator [Mycobacterium sp.]